MATDVKKVEGYKEIKPYYDAVKKSGVKMLSSLGVTDDGDDEWPSFVFKSTDKQKIEVFFDPDSKTICYTADDNWMEADDISLEGVMSLCEAKQSIKTMTMTKVKSASQLIKESVTGNEPEGVEEEFGTTVLNEAAEKLTTDLKPAEFNATLKKLLKAKGIAARVRVINSYKWPKCYVHVWGEMPNELRKVMLEVSIKDTSSVRDMNDINYGNIQKNGIAAHAKEWVEGMEKFGGEIKITEERSPLDKLEKYVDKTLYYDFGDKKESKWLPVTIKYCTGPWKNNETEVHFSMTAKVAKQAGMQQECVTQIKIDDFTKHFVKTPPKESKKSQKTEETKTPLRTDIFVVWGAAGRFNGCMVVRAKDKAQAKKIGNDEWLDTGRVTSVQSLKDYAKSMELGVTTMEEFEAEDGMYIPEKMGEWKEIDWGT